MSEKLLELFTEYDRVLDRQKFVEDDLNYETFEKHIPFLEQLDTIESGGILVFDLYKREHIFVSKSLEHLLGYDVNEIYKTGNEYFDIRMHPDDQEYILAAAIQYLNYYFSFSKRERPSIKFKAINEYRLKNGAGNYIRAIEQFMPLEFDCHNNIWLVVSVLDAIPSSNLNNGASSRLYLPNTGELMEYLPKSISINPLSNREKEILHFIAKGLPSKQIADKLFISVNTVNTHRQKIIEKLRVGNTFEALQYAQNIGLFE